MVVQDMSTHNAQLAVKHLPSWRSQSASQTKSQELARHYTGNNDPNQAARSSFAGVPQNCCNPVGQKAAIPCKGEAIAALGLVSLLAALLLGDGDRPGPCSTRSKDPDRWL